jgi:hypothetical protein
MRLLIAYEDSHNLYSEAMERAIRNSRPHLEIKIARTSELEAEIERFAPHMVLCERRNLAQPGGAGAWVKNSYEPGEPSEVCIDGRRWKLDNPTMNELLAIIDETEELMRTGHDVEGC